MTTSESAEEESRDIKMVKDCLVDDILKQDPSSSIEDVKRIVESVDALIKIRIITMLKKIHSV